MPYFPDAPPPFPSPLRFISGVRWMLFRVAVTAGIVSRFPSSFAVDFDSLKDAGLPFELQSWSWVMRDLAVYIGANGLGLQLDVRHGGVKVDGHTEMPPGVSNSGKVRRRFSPSLPRVSTSGNARGAFAPSLPGFSIRKI